MQQDEFTQQVRDAIDIVDVISDQTRLQRRGKRLLGLCPFHKEKTPSFSVDPDQRLYYCFGCGAGGDALGFHMQITGDDFRTALETMAQRFGVKIPERGRDGRGLDLDAALNAAEEFFTDQLAHSAFAKRYLERRQIDAELVTSYGVGFAPDGWQHLHDALGGNFSADVLLAAGLIGRSDGGRFYDRFRNRLMFPIRSTTGRLVGFGGRTLGDDQAKYVNSAETEAFRKGSILYGLDRARPKIRESGKVLLVEGYFDVLGAVASGVEWTVASMGTALTQAQAKLIVRYADEVIIGYDGDRAGDEAARKALAILLPSGLSVRRARFPAGSDPDSLRLEEGPSVVRDIIEGAPDAVLLEIEKIPPEASSDPRRAALVAGPLAQLIGQVSDELVRREYAKRAAGRLGVTEDLLLRAPRARAHANASAEGDAPRTLSDKATMEHQVLGLLLAGARPERLLPEEAFWDRDSRVLYAAWCSVAFDEERERDVVSFIRARVDGQALELLARLALASGVSRKTVNEDPTPELEVIDDQALDQLEDLLRVIQQRYERHENRRLRDALVAAQREGDDVRVQNLLAQKLELSQRLHGRG